MLEEISSSKENLKLNVEELDLVEEETEDDEENDE